MQRLLRALVSVDSAFVMAILPIVGAAIDGQLHGIHSRDVHEWLETKVKVW